MTGLVRAGRAACGRIGTESIRPVVAASSVGYAVGSVLAGDPLGEQLWLLAVVGGLAATRAADEGSGS